MKSLLVCTLFVLLSGCAAAPSTPAPADAKPAPDAPKPPPTLDGTTWKIAVEPLDEADKPYTDYLKFEEHHLGSLVQQKLKFNSGSYSSETREGILTFDGKLTNAEGETFAITGRATADILWGAMTWRRADWTLRTYRFRGEPGKP